MKHRRSLISIAMAILLLVSIFAVISSSTVSVNGQATGSTAPLGVSPPVGTAAGTAPAISSWGVGRLDVFVQGTDNALWHKWWDNAKWSGPNYEPLGGKLTSSPAAVSWGVGRIDVVMRGTDGAVWQKFYATPNWYPASVSLGSPP